MKTYTVKVPTPDACEYLIIRFVGTFGFTYTALIHIQTIHCVFIQAYYRCIVRMYIIIAHAHR